MIVNVPKEIPFAYYVRCIDDSPSVNRKPVIDWVVKGQIYTVYSVAKALNTNSIAAYYIKDMDGRKVEGHEGIPAWMAERFELVLPSGDDGFQMSRQCLN